MCYAIPGRIKAITGKIAFVDYFGEERKALNEMEELRKGDFVYAQGGYIIERIPLAEAEEILSVWKETFFELQEADLRLSRLDLEKAGIDRKLGFILDGTIAGRPLSETHAVYLLGRTDPRELDLIFKSANFLRQKHLKNACCVHGILEISNACSQPCLYCGISTHHRTLKRYRMTPDEIVENACLAVARHGFKALVLQSGEDAGYSIGELASVVRRIKAKTPALIFISFGEIGFHGLEQLYEAGARGLLMRFETSNPALYSNLHPGSDLETRLSHLREAYKLGYLLITGGLVGVPGQTREDLVRDLFLAKELHAEMMSFGPFLPHPNTPLKDSGVPEENDILKVLAVTRLLEPTEARILITTAFETLSENARRKGLLAGANSVMLNVTPAQYRRQYEIYPNRAYGDDGIEKQIEDVVNLLASLGRAPTDLGISRAQGRQPRGFALGTPELTG